MRKRETLRFLAIASETRREHLVSESRLAGRRYVPLCYGQPPEYRHLRDDSVNCATGSHDGPCAHTAPPKPAAALRSSRQRLPALKRLRRLGYKQINIAKYSVQVGSSQAAGWLKSVHRSPSPQAASQPPTRSSPYRRSLAGGASFFAASPAHAPCPCHCRQFPPCACFRS